MALEDGSLLIHPDRYDSLRRQGMGEDELASRRLLRVDPQFMVIAIGLPVPRFPGTTLDPPLRSRFQARAIAPPPAATRKRLLSAIGTASAAAPLAKAVDALDALDAMHAMRAGGAAGAGGASDYLLPCAPAGSLVPIARLAAAFPLTPLAGWMERILPHASTSSELASLLDKFDLSPPAGASSSSSSVPRYEVHALRPVHGGGPSSPAAAGAATEESCGGGGRSSAELSALADDGRLAAVDWRCTGSSAAADTTTTTWVPCGPLGVEDVAPSAEGSGGGSALGGSASGAAQLHLATLPHQTELLSALMQDHHVGVDACLVGGKGVGKTSIARRFAASLGYTPRTVFCYADLPARDLLQRRSMDEAGTTIWEDAEAVTAAVNGEMLIVDNIHRLPSGTLAATLGRLVTDRQLQLPDGRRLLPRAQVEALRAAGECTEEELSRLVPVHPAFRIVATAETPTAWLAGGGGAAAGGGGGGASAGWLGSEMLGLFHFHRVPGLSTADHAALVSHIFAVRHAAASASASASAAAAAASSSALAAEATATKLVAFHEALGSPSRPGALHGLSLTTRGLLRTASHAASGGSERTVARALRREVTGPRGQLNDATAASLVELMRTVGLDASAAEGSAYTGVGGPPLPAPVRVADGPDGAAEALIIGDDCRVGGILPPARPELVPEVVYFDSARHTSVLRELLLDFAAGSHLLMIGSQGVGKNKLADRMLELLRREREYMQLHRDVTVSALTQTPNLTSGKLVWEDSPLVRALTHGRVLLLDEADKAPLEVTCVLRSLLSEGEMLLSDGRRVAPKGTPPAPGVLPIADGFQAVVLANRPGYPFLGNDFFRECGDVLSCHTVFNPDLLSEVQLLRQYAPDVPDSLLQRVASVFADLRGAPQPLPEPPLPPLPSLPPALAVSNPRL